MEVRDSDFVFLKLTRPANCFQVPYYSRTYPPLHPPYNTDTQHRCIMKIEDHDYRKFGFFNFETFACPLTPPSLHTAKTPQKRTLRPLNTTLPPTLDGGSGDYGGKEVCQIQNPKIGIFDKLHLHDSCGCRWKGGGQVRELQGISKQFAGRVSFKNTNYESRTSIIKKNRKCSGSEINRAKILTP